MKEIVIISGKGGTGKTSLTASLAALSQRSILADCDVDAPDLHLILKPDVMEHHPFISGHQAIIRPEDCTGCGICKNLCRFDAVRDDNPTGIHRIDPVSCEGCGVCVFACPSRAIDFPERTCGAWFVSRTQYGTMVHAQLGIGSENSGKLVSVVRKAAKKLAESNPPDLLIVDGPPGIGCPVIASITESEHILAVTEPSLSGLHDLERVIELVRHFKIPMSVCINKWDINPELSERINALSEKSGVTLLGRIPYDGRLSQAQCAGQSLIDYAPDSPSAEAVTQIWNRLCQILNR